MEKIQLNLQVSANLRIQNLLNTPLEVIVNCLNESFQGYYVQLPSNTEYWRDRFRIARVDFKYSFGMFDQDKLVGFIIQGIGDFAGRPTVFNTGTGVLPSYRGKRIVDELYNVAIPLLTTHGFNNYLLEVIEENKRGIRVYERIGFKKVRKLYCYKGQINIPANGLILKKLDEKLPTSGYQDERFYSWDHTRDAIMASKTTYETFIVSNEQNNEVGYFTINPATGYVARMEKTTMGSYKDLLGGISRIAKEIKINNVPEDRSILRLELLNAGLVNVINQFEMGKNT